MNQDEDKVVTAAAAAAATSTGTDAMAASEPKEDKGKEKVTTKPSPAGVEENEGEEVGGVLRKRQRYLANEDEVFSHNAWDDVEWDEEQEQKAQDAVQKNSQHPVSFSDKGKLDPAATTATPGRCVPLHE